MRKEDLALPDEALASQYAIAAFHLRECHSILEIISRGGTCISDYLSGSARTVSILYSRFSKGDSGGVGVDEKGNCFRSLEDFRLSGDEEGLVFLDMNLPPENWDLLTDLLRACKIAVLEISPSNRHQVTLIRYLLESGFFDVKTRIVFDFSGNAFLDSLGDKIFPPLRHLYVVFSRERSKSYDMKLNFWIARIKDYPSKSRREILHLIARKGYLRAKGMYRFLEMIEENLSEEHSFQRASETKKKEKGLLSRNYLNDLLLHKAPYRDGHGATGDYLGLGILYYALAYFTRARLCVCLGSGGGFVPRIMRQAQRDLDIGTKSTTVLVDAIVSEEYRYNNRTTGTSSFFSAQYPEVRMLRVSTCAAAKILAAEAEKIDYLHIDADHSFAGSLLDYEMFRPLMTDNFVMTIHDTCRKKGLRKYEVYKTIARLREKDDIELIDFDHLWSGVAIVKPRR